MATSCRAVFLQWPLLEYQKQMIPYQVGQKVSFSNTKGDHFLFATKNMVTKWREDTEQENWWSQYRVVYLQSESGETISLHLDSYNENCLTVSIRDHHFHLVFNCAGQFYRNNDRTFVYDSLSINDKVYYDIVRQDDEENNQLYYNKTHGILQMKQNDETILVLE